MVEAMVGSSLFCLFAKDLVIGFSINREAFTEQIKPQRLSKAQDSL